MPENRKPSRHAAPSHGFSGQTLIAREPPGLGEALARMPVTETLSLDHAMLQRILLAVEALLANADTSTDLAPICEASEQITKVVEQRHMRFEEENVYPRFREGVLAEIVDALAVQHDEARRLNGKVCTLTSTGNVRDRSETVELCRLAREYRVLMTAHAAWEETMLFPAMAGTMSDGELNDLKELNESQLRRTFGRDPLKKLYEQLSTLERACGVTGIRDFTRRP